MKTALKGITIRHASSEDSALLLELIRELAEYEKLAQDVTATEARLRETLFGAEPAARVLLAFKSGEPAGYVVYFFTYSTFRAQKCFYIEDIFVRETLRQLGIGLRLFAESVKIAQEEGCARMDWNVLDWNSAARGFYERLGGEAHSHWIRYSLRNRDFGKVAVVVEKAVESGRGLI